LDKFTDQLFIDASAQSVLGPPFNDRFVFFFDGVFFDTAFFIRASFDDVFFKAAFAGGGSVEGMLFANVPVGTVSFEPVSATVGLAFATNASAFANKSFS
jgi:hypothetical protein